MIENDRLENHYLLMLISSQFNRGVELFFVISGFILSLPFIQCYQKEGKKVSLKSYYLRRLTRLEPPYILVLILLTLLNLVTRHNTMSELFPHFLASLFYCHNIFFPGTLPLINGITWSLEIEVQFYILAPLLCSVFIIKNYTIRTVIILLTLLVAAGINTLFKFPILSLSNYLHYFLTGFLLADIYVTGNKKIINTPWLFLSGITAIIMLFVLPPHPINQFLLPLCIFIQFYAVLYQNLLNLIFSFPLVTVIGGMCYSIYLLHTYTIAIADHFTDFHSSLGWYSYILVQSVIILPLVLLVGALFFISVEKPCMDKNWLPHLWRKLLNKPLASQ